MSNYGIRPINRSCGSYGCHCPPNDGRQNTADMPDTTPWRDRGDYYVLALLRMLGHTSAAMTLDTYSDLFDDDLDAIAVTLHSRYSRSSVGKVSARQPTDDR